MNSILISMQFLFEKKNDCNRKALHTVKGGKTSRLHAGLRLCNVDIFSPKLACLFARVFAVRVCVLHSAEAC